MPAVKDRLQRLQRRNHWTRTKLASEMHVTTQALYNWATGKTAMSEENKRRLAELETEGRTGA